MLKVPKLSRFALLTYLLSCSVSEIQP